MTKVAGVVVTFNRKALVTACIDALLAQTRPVDMLFVIDNASTDGTCEALAERGYMDRPDVTYVRLDSNTGGAGGFHEGMRLAHEAGYDWIWIMDDDCEARADTLALLERHFDEPDVVALWPTIADADGNPDFGAGAHGTLMLPHSQMREDRIHRPLTPEEFAAAPAIPIDVLSFVGPCFPRWIIDKAGLPIKDFFIHFDDVEYALRIGKFGKLLLITEARILHRQAQIASAVESKMQLGKQRNRIRIEALWLRYFGYRNLIWLKTHGRIAGTRAEVLRWHARVLIRVLLYDDHKLTRLRFWNAAFWDGWLGRFDNSKARKLLGR